MALPAAFVRRWWPPATATVSFFIVWSKDVTKHCYRQLFGAFLAVGQVSKGASAPLGLGMLAHKLKNPMKK